MRQTRMWRAMGMAAVVLGATLAMSGVARAHDGDDYRQGGQAQARQYGYDNGYRDGLGKGRHEGRENDPYDYRTPDWRQATHGYKDWMGPANWYQSGYQEGYRDGFRSGFESVTGRRGDGDRDDRRASYGWREERGPGGYGDVAYRIGYEDGSGVGWRDVEKRNSYNPNPRGKFDDRDHGYRREYGSKDQYKAEYTAGYRAGYESVMGNR